MNVKESIIYYVVESEWKAIARCRRLWSAMALSCILRGLSFKETASAYGCEVAELENLQRSAKLNCGKVQRFCSEVGWTPFERLINDFKSDLDVTVPKELRSLVQVPHLTVKVNAPLDRNSDRC